MDNNLITKSQRTKRTHCKPNEQLYPNGLPLSYLTLPKYHLDTWKVKTVQKLTPKQANTEKQIRYKNNNSYKTLSASMLSFLSLFVILTSICFFSSSVALAWLILEEITVPDFLQEFTYPTCKIKKEQQQNVIKPFSLQIFVLFYFSLDQEV